MAVALSRPSLRLDVRVPHIEPVVTWLAIASGIEMLILRTFTRTAIHIPALEQLAGPYQAVSAGGRYAYYVAAVLLVVALPLAASVLWAQGSGGARAAAVGVAGFMLAAAMARSGLGSPATVDFLTVAAVAGVAAATAARLERRTAFAIMAFATAFVLIAAHSLLQSAVGEGARVFDARPLLAGGELVAVGFALSAPWTMRAIPGRRPMIAAWMVGLVIFAMLARNAPTTKILLLWNEGLTGAYPSLVYALSAAALVATLAGLMARGERLPAVAFALLLIGGFGLHSTYQTGLVVVGLALLAVAKHVPTETRPDGSKTAQRGSSGPE